MSKLLYPPFNFSSVENQLYRSAFFNELNSKYLESLRLKTVIALEDVIHPSMQSFCIENHVNLISFKQSNIPQNPLSPTWSSIDEDKVIKSLKVLTESYNYPVLITCSSGRDMTGTVIGCVRKLQKWSLMSILEEFRRYSGPRQQQLEQFIELFDTDLIQITDQSPMFFKKI